MGGLCLISHHAWLTKPGRSLGMTSSHCLDSSTNPQDWESGSRVLGDITLDPSRGTRAVLSSAGTVQPASSLVHVRASKPPVGGEYLLEAFYFEFS